MKVLSFCTESQQTELPFYCVITHLSSNRRHGWPPPSYLYWRVRTPRCRYCSLLRHVVRSSHPGLPIIVASQHQRTSNRLYWALGLARTCNISVRHILVIYRGRCSYTAILIYRLHWNCLEIIPAFVASSHHYLLTCTV